MESLLSSLKINVNPCLYIKDPESSELGQSIISESIELINELGIENFNFKKLGNSIKSNESSIYRYFENKYKLLQYLSALYWGILEYRLVIETNALENPSKKLLRAIKILTLRPQNIAYYSNVDQLKLRDIVISEFTKSYHHKHVDSDNDDGNFKNYKRLVLRLVEMIEEANPEYKFPKSLACQIVEGALQQNFMQKHFTSLVDKTDDEQIYLFFKDITISVLNLK
jgi:AcrR family transcriptional regulator